MKKMMNYRCFIWTLPLLAFVSAVHAVALDEECIDEPVFNGRVCVYQTNRDATKSLFLVHGIGDNASRDWNSQVSDLSAEFHLITFDLPGFGHSEHGKKDYSPENYAALIEFIVQRYSIKRFDLMGHSMGAAVSMLYASRFPQRVRRLVVVDAAGVLHRMAVGKFVIAGAIDGDSSETGRTESYVVKMIEKFERLFAFIRNDIAEQNEHAKVGMELLDYDFGAALDTIEAPTLVVWGEEDTVAPLRTATVIDYRIKQSQIKVVKGAGHLPMKDKSQEFNNMILEFLQAVKVDDVVDKVEAGLPHRSGHCNGQVGVSFSGSYDRIELVNCSDVMIQDATVGEIYAFESRVVIEHSRVGGDVAVAVESVGSDIKMTASKVSGGVAIQAARSRFDLAAVDLHPKDKVVIAQSKSRFIFSVSRLYGASGVHYLHDSVTLGQGETM